MFEKKIKFRLNWRVLESKCAADDICYRRVPIIPAHTAPDTVRFDFQSAVPRSRSVN